MKRKMKGVMGVGLAVILISSLFGFAFPVSAAAPLPTINAWDTFDYPAQGATGGWFYAPDITGVGPIARAIDGDLYAAVTRGEPTETLGASTGNSTAWACDVWHSAPYSAYLNYVSGDHAYVELTPPPGITVNDLASITSNWSFWYYLGAGASNGPLLELRFTMPGYDPATGYGHVDITCDYAEWNFTTGAWTEVQITNLSTAFDYGNDPVDGTAWGSATQHTLAAILAAIDAEGAMIAHGASAADWELTRVRVEIGWVGNARTAYIDDVMIDGSCSHFDPAVMLVKSVDGGRSWAESISPFKYAGGPVVDMVCSSLLEDVIYATDGNNIYKSSDGADTWATVAQPDLEEFIEGACGTPITCRPITCLDVGYDAGSNPFVFIGVDVTWKSGDAVGLPTGPPDVLYIDELAIGATWKSLNLSCYDPPAVYTPYAVGVTPDFATAPTKLMVVVTTDDADGDGTADDPETHVISSNLGVCGWGEVAELLWDCQPANHFEIDHAARIGYPDDYVDGRTLFVGVTGVTAEGGDVYSVVTFPVGMATDLNVAGSPGGCEGLFPGTNICGLDVCGDTADAAVIAGAMDDTNVYTSLDGGWTWVTSLKDPTGEVATWVQWVGDECGATALAATSCCDCAVSITCGPVVGLYWNQASLINTCFDCVNVVDHSPGYYQAGVSDTLFMLTKCDDACLKDGDQLVYNVFRYRGDPTLAGTSSPAHPWDRVFSSILYADEIDMKGGAIHFLIVSPDFQDTGAVFIGNHGFEIWRSLDAGCSWFKFDFPCVPRPTISALTVVDKETLVAGGSGLGFAGTTYKTTRHGTRHWTPATALGAGDAMSFDFDGNNFLMGDNNSQVFISSDGALTWSQIDLQVESCGADTSVAFDPGYAVTGDPGENTIYAAANDTISRCVIDPALPMALQTWTEIGTGVTEAWGMSAVGDTTLYVGDRGAGAGMWRTVDATAVVVEFEQINFGLTSETLSGLPLTSGVNGCPHSNVLWATGTSTTCPQVWFFEDTLARQVNLASPANGAQGLSAVIGTTTATIEWEALCGATSYEKEVWYYCPGCLVPTYVVEECFACSTLVPCVGCSGETCCEVVGTPEAPLLPGTTYYWRVRVCGQYPMLSKWSDTWSFTTAMETPVRCSPECGAENITLTPNFSWTEIPGATGYEIEVATNEDFEPIVASGTPTINAWDGIPQLEYGTTYYWRVRAVMDGAVSAWTYCLFSTEEAPPVEIEPAPVWTCPQCGLTFTSEAALLAHIEEAHPAPVTPLYVWIVIGIGAALVIVVIILILSTRRPA